MPASTVVTHEHFLSCIQSDDEPSLTQAIYADWLEEHGDERCELLRIVVGVRRSGLVIKPGVVLEFKGCAQKIVSRLATIQDVARYSDWCRAARIVEFRHVPGETLGAGHWEWVESLNESATD